jgi:hypothetical protein
MHTSNPRHDKNLLSLPADIAESTWSGWQCVPTPCIGNVAKARMIARQACATCWDGWPATWSW